MLLSRESKEPKSTIYTKTTSLFAPYIGTEAATQLAERTEMDLKKINDRTGNPLIILRHLGSVFYNIQQNLCYQETMRQLNVLRDSLITLLSQYATPIEATRIAEAAILKVRVEHKPGEGFFKIDRLIAAQAREQLHALPTVKKRVDQKTFDLDFFIAFDLFEEKIDDKYEEMVDEIIAEFFKNITPDILSDLEAMESDDTYEEIIDKLFSDLEKFMTPEMLAMESKSQAILADEKNTVEQINILNLSTCQPTSKILGLFSEKSLITADEFAKLDGSFCRRS